LARFIDKLRFQELDGPYVELTHRVRYRSDRIDTEIAIPNGFVTDFASVPRLPILYWLWGNRADRAAVVHDYLYRFPEITFSRTRSRFEARVLSDQVFQEANHTLGKSRHVCLPMYVGVRVGGWRAFGRNAGQLDPR
jgi:hypothetical protein